MHFEVLVEDQSGAIAVQEFLKKFFEGHPEISLRIHPYKGIGRLPKDLHHDPDRKKRILLENLPRILRGYGKSLAHSDAAVLVVLDIDQRNCRDLKEELLSILNLCKPAPRALFRIAIEEIEAWYMSDSQAVTEAYPGARIKTLDDYEPDSICGTWEKLADAVYPGGSEKLISLGYPQIGIIKCEWAEKIAPIMDPARNSSKSFQVFREGVLRLAGI